MYESPSVSLLSQNVKAGDTWNWAAVANGVVVWQGAALVHVAAYANVAAATMAVVAAAFLWVVGAVFFNSGIMPTRE